MEIQLLKESNAEYFVGEEFCGLAVFLRKLTVEVSLSVVLFKVGTAVAQWLKCCATNRKIAGSIPDGVIGIFH